MNIKLKSYKSRPRKTLIFFITVSTISLLVGGYFAWAKAAMYKGPKKEVKSAVALETVIEDPSKNMVIEPVVPTKAEDKKEALVPSPSALQKSTPTPIASTPKITNIANPTPKKTTSTPRTSTPAITPAPTNGIYTVSAAQNFVEEEILKLVNAERARLGLRPLSFDAKLRQAADIRAREESVTSFVGVNHTRPDGRSWSTVLPEVGYTGASAWGENLAWGYKSQFSYNTENLKAIAAKIFSQWKNSTGHYAQIKNPNYNQTGLGVSLINQSGRTYWFAIQLFAKK